MGYIYDIISELNKMNIATEADDITGDIEKDINSVGKTINSVSGGNVKTNIDEGAPEGNDNGEIDTNTDDILGTTDDNTEDEADNQENDNDNDDEMGGDDNLDDTGEDDITDDELDETMDKEENPFEFSRKKKIHKQFLDFYNVISSNIKLISEFMPKVVDEESIKILNNVRNNLSQCKEYTYTVLTEEYTALEYPALLKKYVALNRVYDICIKILESYYEKYDNEKNK